MWLIEQGRNGPRKKVFVAENVARKGRQYEPGRRSTWSRWCPRRCRRPRRKRPSSKILRGRHPAKDTIMLSENIGFFVQNGSTSPEINSFKSLAANEDVEMMIVQSMERRKIATNESKRSKNVAETQKKAKTWPRFGQKRMLLLLFRTWTRRSRNYLKVPRLPTFQDVKILLNLR